MSEAAGTEPPAGALQSPLRHFRGRLGRRGTPLAGRGDRACDASCRRLTSRPGGVSMDERRVRVRLAYGEQGLDVDLPADRTTVVEPTFMQAPPDQTGLLRTALQQPVAGPPLRELVQPGQTVAISMCDGTRPQPRDLMIPAVLEELAGIVRLDDVVVLVATGTHRGNSDAEIRAMLGDEVVDRVRVVNHDARDDASLVYLGRHGADVPVFLSQEWVNADVRITTGFVEPHFFAGFSGGPKLVAPGLAGLETVLTLHDAARIGDPRATWAVCEGNPVHDDIRAVVAAVGGVSFGLDVVLNREQGIVEAFGGSLPQMHAAARRASQRLAMQPVPSLFDVVVTTNAGFPLDQNLYQAVKGMSAARRWSVREAPSSAPPSAVTASPTTGPIARCSPPRSRPRPCWPALARAPRRSRTSGRSRCRPRCSRSRTWWCTPGTSPPRTSPRRTSATPTTSRRPSIRRWVRPAHRPASACFPRDPRPSPSSQSSSVAKGDGTNVWSNRHLRSQPQAGGSRRTAA